jgi:hypothetical protein
MGMNVDFLSGLIAELAMENGRVMLPRLGVFVTELAPASFSDKGFTLHPPYRRIVFRESQGDGSLLYERYAQKSGLSLNNAQNEVLAQVDYLVDCLNQDGYVELSRLGKLKKTLSGSILFVQDENLDVSGELVALGPISLKSQLPHKFPAASASSNPVQVVPVEVEEAKDSVVVEQVNEPEEINEPEETEELEELIPRGVITGYVEEEEENTHSSGWIVFLVLLLLTALFFALFYVGVFFYPELLDRILYNETQLELLKYFNK